MERGTAIDTGTHEELVVRCRTYRELLALDGQSSQVQPSEVQPSDGQALDGRASDGQAEPPRRRKGVAVDGPTTVPSGSGLGMGTGTGSGFAVATPAALARMTQLAPATDVPNENADALLVSAMQRPEPYSVKSLIRPERVALSFALSLVILDTLLSLAGPLFVKYGIDNGVIPKSTKALRAAWLGYLAVVVAGFFVVRAHTVLVSLAAERLLYSLRVRVFGQLQRLSLDFYERELTGRLLTRITSDVDALATFLQQGLLSIVVNGLTIVGVAIVLLREDARLGLLSLAGMPLLLAATLWFRRNSRAAYALSRERLATMNARLAESFSGVRVVQASGRQSKNENDFAGVVDAHRQARLLGQRLGSIYFPIIEFVGVATMALVLWVGTGRSDRDVVTTGVLSAFALYLNQLFSPIQQLSNVFDTWQQAAAANHKISELLSVETGTPRTSQPVSLASRHTIREIVFDDVSFSYSLSANEALSEVSVTIKPGETVAVVGETGAGKSTFLKLIARYYDPTSGVLLAGGSDLRAYDLDGYRSMLGVVPQEPVLFSGTIAENIAFGRPGSSREQVEEAARAIGAENMIGELPDGYDTLVAARGRTLSAGQRQLIALARAYLVDPAILLLDEATAQLDLSTEARVQQAMGLLSQGRTTVVVAHRLETARRADRVLVMSEGRIAEQGTHEELLALGGTYASLWAASD